MTAAAKRARSGRSLTDAERRANGQQSIKVWLPAELVEALDAEAKRVGRSRTQVLGEAIIARCARGLADRGARKG
jgi:hypothetical protein